MDPFPMAFKKKNNLKITIPSTKNAQIPVSILPLQSFRTPEQLFIIVKRLVYCRYG